MEAAVPVESIDIDQDNNNHKTDAQIDSRFSCNICLEAVKEPVVTQCGHLYCWPCLYQWLEPGMLPNERRSLSIGYRQLPVEESRRVCPVCKSACSVPTVVPIYVRNDDAAVCSPSQSCCEDRNLHEVGTPVVSNAEGNTTMLNEIDDDDPITSTGLRYRGSRRQSGESPSNAEEDNAVRSVPARPAANNSGRTTEETRSTVPENPTPARNNSVFVSSLSPTTHRASLSHGLALSFQQAMMNGMGPSSPDAIPSLHNNRRDGNFHAHQTTDLESDPDSTEFLSRLLLMLGSFVIFCLLLF